ncbi:Polyketide cyclase / dehydrase and lipid transport [Ekhidna lutea]|uniref:Polyketide cyclase / dehydrase and lipid transport n=1 Tax=Ekhidna lutea TaxID=447679 RepID=A0A239GL78_EKHLU|nr:SRPBCC family protein [Ekhidna lutea]SNS69731.1 Polyketide cyclase / dehydrase and lipid transport [Ekhidna lutea]
MKRLNALAQKGQINENASIRDMHSIIINADIDKVWKILVNMEDWPKWNPEVKKVTKEGELAEGTVFKWVQGRTHGVSQIQALSKPNLLTWTSKASMVKRIYVWTLESDEGQTIATVSASFQGFMVVLAQNHQKVYDELLSWLECLKNKAEE